MTSNTRRPALTDAEREQRRTADRERAKQAANALLSSEGWTRWVHARQLFHSYSLSNQLILALAFHERGIDPEPVAGFRTGSSSAVASAKASRAWPTVRPNPALSCSSLCSPSRST